MGAHGCAEATPHHWLGRSSWLGSDLPTSAENMSPQALGPSGPASGKFPPWGTRSPIPQRPRAPRPRRPEAQQGSSQARWLSRLLPRPRVQLRPAVWVELTAVPTEPNGTGSNDTLLALAVAWFPNSFTPISTPLLSKTAHVCRQVTGKTRSCGRDTQVLTLGGCTPLIGG